MISLNKSSNNLKCKPPTPLITIPIPNNKKPIQLFNCPSLLKSPKKLILNSSSYKSFVSITKSNQISPDTKYPTISTTTNNSFTSNKLNKKPLMNIQSYNTYNTHETTNKTTHINCNKAVNKPIGLNIPHPRLKDINDSSRNKPLYHFNTFYRTLHKKQKGLTANTSLNSITDTSANQTGNIKVKVIGKRKGGNSSELISARSFIDELSNVKNAIKENLLYHLNIQQNQHLLKDYINASIIGYLTKRQHNPIEEGNNDIDIDIPNQCKSTLTKTIQVSSKYTIELKLISYSIHFKDITNNNNSNNNVVNPTSNNQTITLPFEFIIYFLCCHKHIDLIFNFLSYNADTKDFYIDHPKFKLTFLSQVSSNMLDYTYKEPISSIWLTMKEVYQFTTIQPQMAFSLLECNSKLIQFTKQLDSKLIVNLMKENFANWDLLVLNSFSIYKSFRTELSNIFSFKQKQIKQKQQYDLVNRTYSKISINSNNTTTTIYNIDNSNSNDTDYYNERITNDNDDIKQTEQLANYSWDFITTINNIAHCNTFYSFKVEIKTEEGIMRTLNITLKELKQIGLLSNQWSLYETIRRLLIVDTDYVPRLNVNTQLNINETNSSSNNNVNGIHKYKRSISIKKEEELAPLNKKESRQYTYIDSNKMHIKIADPFFTNEDKSIFVIPMDLLIAMATLNFCDWPIFIRNHYDILFKNKLDLAPTCKKKGFRSSKSLRIGIVKRRFAVSH